MESTKKRLTSAKQFKHLLKEMREHPSLASGIPVFGEKKLSVDKEWERVKRMLNNMGPPIRQTAEWKKIWSDMKARARKKISENTAARMKTGGGPFVEIPLSRIEKKTVAVMNYISGSTPHGRFLGMPQTAVTAEVPIEASLQDVCDPGDSLQVVPEPLPQPQPPPPPPPPTQADSDKELFNLLCEIDKYNYIYLFERCKACNVNARQLKYFEKDHVRELVPKTNLGILAEFEFLLQDWKSRNVSNNIGVPFYAPTKTTTAKTKTKAPNVTTPTPNHGFRSYQDFNNSDSPGHVLPDNENTVTQQYFVDFLENSINDESQGSVSLTSSHASEEGDSSIQYALNEIIPTVMKKCLKKYKTNRGQLTEVERRILTTAISDYFNSLDIQLTTSTIEHLADQIVQHFPSENKSTWFDRRNSKGRGRLYVNLHNSTKRKEKSFGTAAKKSRKEEPLISYSPSVLYEDASMDEDTDQEMEQIQKWLKCNKCEDLDEVMNMWHNSLRYRKRQLQNIARNSEEGISEILNVWPAYTTSSGHLLLNKDFNYLHPKSEAAWRERWPIFMKKIVPLMEAEFKDNNNVELFNQFKENSSTLNTDSREAILLKLLHAITKPSRCFNTSQGTRRFSIAESQVSVMRLIQHVSELDSFSEQQPCIFLVGDSIVKVESCVVAFRNIRYELPFADAVRTCLQIYTIFKVAFPMASLNFWTFVRGYFFDIHDEDETPYTVMDNIVKYLETYKAV